MAPGFKRRAEAEVAVGAVRVPGGVLWRFGDEESEGDLPLRWERGCVGPLWGGRRRPWDLRRRWVWWGPWGVRGCTWGGSRRAGDGGVGRASAFSPSLPPPGAGPEPCPDAAVLQTAAASAPGGRGPSGETPTDGPGAAGREESTSGPGGRLGGERPPRAEPCLRECCALGLLGRGSAPLLPAPGG